VLTACFLLGTAQDPAAALPPFPDHDVRLELASAEPGAHPEASATHRADFAGGLHVWTDGDDGLDLDLRVSAEDGSLLATDRDSGGKPRPYLRLEVEPGKVLTIVARARPEDRGTFTLRLVAAPESEASSQAAQHARETFSELERLQKSGDLDAARSAATELLEELLPLAGSSRSDAVSESLLALGWQTYGLGMLPETEIAWRAVLAHREGVLPPDHVGIQSVVGSIAAVIAPQGRLAESRALLERTLEVSLRTLPADAAEIQHARMNLGATLRELGELERSREILETAVETWSRTLPAEDLNTQRARINLSMTLRQLGDLPRARVLAEESLRVVVSTLAEEHPFLQTARSALASVLFELGDFTGARALQESVLENLSGRFPEEHYDVLAARVALALTLESLGDHEAARSIQERVLEIRLQTLPEDDPGVQQARLNLATAMQELGDVERARELEEAALEMLTRNRPPDDPWVLQAKENLSVTLARLGDDDGVRELLEEVLAARTATLDPGDVDLQRSRENLATVALRQGDDTTAIALARELVASVTVDARSDIWACSPREAAEICARRQDIISSLLSMGRELRDPGLRADLDRRLFGAIESLRAADLAVGGMASLLRGDPEVEACRRSVRETSAELARRVAAGAGRDELDPAIAARDEARRRMTAALTGRPAMAAFLEDSSARLLALKASEPTALVGYWSYESWELPSGAKVERATPAFLAFVVGPGGVLTRIELGPAEPIALAVAAWRDAVGVGAGRGVGVRTGVKETATDEAAVSRAGDALRRIVIDPLRAAIGDARRIVVVPDGVLHLVAFDALPDGENRLGDARPIEIRSSLRELLWNRGSVDTDGALTALGGAEFDPYPADGAHGGFRPLPATALEARAIADLHRLVASDPARTRLLEGRAAGRAALESAAPTSRWMHVATHGWFAPETPAGRGERRPVDRVLGLHAPSETERIRGSSPMLLAGLALAGANAPADATGRRDGLVTAEEVSSWELSGCELAVLSACETGAGLGRAGQGVASLQRALQLAGARSVITSLWKVPDQATQELMVDFYRRLWIERKPKAQALWEAKMALRDARDEHGRSRHGRRVWAARLLTGEPR